ncbi:MAG: helix-turn-helix domain-containing protein [Alphaproteobacteria bacterium]|nr:helix-turn-helix domain-containing protein [Alphaproteobacteria bacterium]
MDPPPTRPAAPAQLPMAPAAGFLSVVPNPAPRFNRFQVERGLLASTLPPLARLVALVLLSHADRKGECFPGVPRLMSETGLARASVFRELRRLEAVGYVERRARYGKDGRRSNTYCLDPLDGNCGGCGLGPIPNDFRGTCGGCGLDFAKPGGSHTETHPRLTQRPLTNQGLTDQKANSGEKN